MKLFTNKKGVKMNKEQLEIIKYIVKKTEEAISYKNKIDIELDKIETDYKEKQSNNENPSERGFYQTFNFEAGIQKSLIDEIEQYGRDIISILQSDN